MNGFFPTLTCGVFVFSAVSASSFSSSRLSSQSSLTHVSLTHTSHTHTHSLAHTSSISSLAHTHTPHTHHSHTHTHHSHTHITYSHTHHSHYTYTTHPNHTHHTLTHISLTHTCTPWRPSGVPLASLGLRHSAGGFCVASAGLGAPAKGSDVRPGVPLALALPVAFAWQVRDLVHCKGVGCTPWRPSGVPLASLGLRRSAGGFCVAGAGLGALQRDRMYALASLWRPLLSAALPVAFAWQAWAWCMQRGWMCALASRHLVHCKGVGCTPWRPSGVPLASLGFRRSAGGFCVAGAGLGALQRGRMYALASLWRPLPSAALPVAFVWQAWDLVHYCHPTSHHTKIKMPPNLTSHKNSITSHTHTYTYVKHPHAHHIYYKLPLTPGTHIVNTLPSWHTADTPVHAHTYIHTNSPTITPPSLSSVLFPCCFSMLSLSLEKLLTCGVIRSYNLKIRIEMEHQWDIDGILRIKIKHIDNFQKMIRFDLGDHRLECLVSV